MTIIAVVVVHSHLMSYVQSIGVNEGGNLSSSRMLFLSAIVYRCFAAYKEENEQKRSGRGKM
jgi:hypothetical protein